MEINKNSFWERENPSEPTRITETQKFMAAVASLGVAIASVVGYGAYVVRELQTAEYDIQINGITNNERAN